MKTKIYTLLLFCIMAIALPQRLQAQVYQPMAVDNAHWVVKMIDGLNSWVVIGLWEYYCQGDTIVDNIAYKKVFRRELQATMDPPPFTPTTYYSLFGFLRDDITARKVYARIVQNDYYSFECGYEQDNLLFDFSLQPDDEINFCTMPSFYEATLSSISTGQAFGVDTKIFTASNMFNYYEGIGSDFGLFEDMFWPVKNTDELERTELYYYCASDPCAYTLPDVTLLTVGEVFDFTEGDQFQYRGEASGQPLNADRITITGKFYSQNNDTIFYEREHNSYYTTVTWNNGQPVLEYVFYTETDTVSYTNLDEPISVLDGDFLVNVNVISSPNYLCNTLINRSDILNNPGGFPGDHTIAEYGKGLGLTWNYLYSGDGQTTLYNDKLFYYKKGSDICGVPDVVKSGGLKIESSLVIYPNPATDYITLNFDKPVNDKAIFSIINSAGYNCASGTIIRGTNNVNIENLPSGLYLLKIMLNDRIYTGKFIKN